MPWTPGPVLNRISYAINLSFIPEPARRRVFLAINLTTFLSPLYLQQVRARQEQRNYQKRKLRKDARLEFEHQME